MTVKQCFANESMQEWLKVMLILSMQLSFTHRVSIYVSYNLTPCNSLYVCCAS